MKSSDYFMKSHAVIINHLKASENVVHRKYYAYQGSHATSFQCAL